MDLKEAAKLIQESIRDGLGLGEGPIDEVAAYGNIIKVGLTNGDFFELIVRKTDGN